MQLITFHSAQRLTGLSRRTLWRRIAQGALKSPHRNRIALELVLKDIPVPLSATDIASILRADQGEAEAQHEVALLFMGYQHAERALPWLQSAADLGCTDAMYWLGRGYIAGHALPQDEHLGLSWICRAARDGHFIAQQQMTALNL